MGSPNENGVFISYARKDGAELAGRLRKDLAAQKFEVWLDTQDIGGGATWTREIEEGLDKAQVVLALMTPGSYVSEICRAEQLRALRKHKHVIPVMGVRGSDVALHLEAKNYRDFTGVKTYADELAVLLEDIRGRKNGVELQQKFRETYVTAPPLPRNYLERPDALASLRDALITDGGGRSIALTALEGMGGIGKTILAQALCHDEVVQQAFPDGIIWTSVGKEHAYDLSTRMREVRRALGDEPGDKETELECKNRYRNAIRQKAALIVADDVWHAGDVEPFLAESRRSRLLFTTRDASIAAALGADEQTAGLLSVEQSRALLARWSGLTELPGEADDLIRECGRLPLALSMVGAMLRGKPHVYWTHVHNLLRTADLAKIKAQFPDYPHADLLRAIQVSADALDLQARERYFALAVLLEDMPAHPVIQQTLWDTDEFGALETAEQLVGLSLAQREGEDGSIRLHDLQLDYVRAQFPDRDSLTLIHGAVRLSSHVIQKDPWQFASQLIGRLLPYKGVSAIGEFTASLTKAAPRPWIRPLRPTLHPPGAGLIRTLAGHSNSVYGVAVTPDGRRAVSASSDKILKLWDLETGREIRTLKGHSSGVNAVAVTPDGHRAVSASWDNTLKIWDLETGEELRSMTGHSAGVNEVAITPDGRQAVSASADKTLKVWDLETGCELRTLKGHSAGVHGVAVAQDGLHAVSASGDHTLKVWDLKAGRELRRLEGHSNWVSGVALTPDGKRAVSSSWDATLKVWDLETGRELKTLKGHSFFVSSVAVIGDSRAVSASWDNTLKIWDLETGRALRTLEGHSAPVNVVAVTAGGRRVVSASGNQILVWDLESGREHRRVENHSGRVNSVAVTSDSRLAASASYDKTLKVWDLKTGRELRTMEGHSAPVNGVAVTPAGRQAISSSRDKSLKLWDLETGRELRTLEGHTDWVFGVAFAGDGRRAISGSEDTLLKLWDLETGRELRSLTGHSSTVYGVAGTADGRQAVSASGDHTLKVWDLDTGREVRSLEGHSDFVFAVALSRDSGRLVSASWDHTVKVWNLETGSLLSSLEDHSAEVHGIALAPDGSWAVSACHDMTLKVWDLNSNRAVATFTCDSAVECCTFASNGLIVAGDLSGEVHFLALEE